MQAQLIVWTLRRRPWRNLLITVSVAMTVAVMVAFFSTRIELSRFFDRLDSIPYQRFWVKPKDFEQQGEYPLALKKQLEQVPGVQQVLYVMFVRGKTSDGVVVRGQGASDMVLEIERDFFPVDDESIARWKKDPAGVILGEAVAKAIHRDVGQEGEMVTATGPVRFTVAGISHDTVLQSRAIFHYDYINASTGNKSLINEYRIVMDKKADSRPIAAAVEDVFAQRGMPSQLLSERTMMAVIGAGEAGMIPNLLGALGFVLLLTTALAIANTTVISVRERRAELATLRVLGFHRFSVALMIVNEMLIVCLVGGIIGTALAYFVMRDGISLGLSLMQSVTMSRTGLIAGLVTSIVVPLIGSVASSWLAVRAPLSQALRDSG